MQFLGHRSIKTTLRYTQLIAFPDDEYKCKVVDNIDQAKQLNESGFNYVTDIEGLNYSKNESRSRSIVTPKKGP